MKAIVTKYRGPTDNKGSAIRCMAEGVTSRTYTTGSLDTSKDTPEWHREAARRYAKQLGWFDGYEMVSGSLPDGSYAHTFRPSHQPKSASNSEGVTWLEWLAAAGLRGKPFDRSAAEAWKRGEDPTEWRATSSAPSTPRG